MRVGFFASHRNKLGESPLWDEDGQCLWWIDAEAVDARAGHIRAARHDGTAVADWRFDRAVGSIALARGGLIAAMADGFYGIDRAGQARSLWQGDTLGGALRFNDGKLDRQGRFLAGQLETVEQRSPAAGLWRIDGPGPAARLVDGMRLVNAICISPSGDTLYFADSLEGIIRIHRYDGESGAVGARIGAIDCGPLGSMPDGATVDRDGNLWVALVRGQAVVCLSPSGTLLRRIELPIPFPSCPAFGGPDLATLFVTTIADSGRHLHSDHPDAGRIVTIEGLGTSGIAEARWPAATAESGS